MLIPALNGPKFINMNLIQKKATENVLKVLFYCCRDSFENLFSIYKVKASYHIFGLLMTKAFVCASSL